MDTDHERTVSEARLGMSLHDGYKPLARWFQNYRDDKNAIFWENGWITVTRDGRRWKVDFGRHDSDVPWKTVYADPHAPAPPVFEFRAPPPEPVKPRFNVPPPPRIDEWARGTLTVDTLQAMARMIGATMEIPPRYIAMDYASGPDSTFYHYLPRPRFDRVAAPPPPPPTRRNQ